MALRSSTVITGLALVALAASAPAALAAPATSVGARPTVPASQTPVVAMCQGEEDHDLDTSIRRQPDSIVLQCDSYGPQYGNPNTEYLDKLSWVSWGRKKALGYGMFTYGPPLTCPPDGSGCVGGIQATLIARVELSDPKPFGRGGKRTTFTKVTVTVSAVPDQPFGPQVFTYTPPLEAYS